MYVYRWNGAIHCNGDHDDHDDHDDRDNYSPLSMSYHHYRRVIIIINLFGSTCWLEQPVLLHLYTPSIYNSLRLLILYRFDCGAPSSFYFSPIR